MAVSDLTIVYRDPKDLVAFGRNSRTHTDAQVKAIAGSIKEWGFTNPVLLKEDGKTIGAGHARTAAALILGLTSIPTIVLNNLTEAQWRAYVIADNKLAEVGSGWDAEMLRLEMTDLKELGFDVSLTGFTFDEVSDLLKGPMGGRGDPDFVPPEPAEPISRAGDVWLLGKHVLTCGDSTDPEVVARVLQGHRPHLMVTDPPYGVDYEASWRRQAGLNNTPRLGVVENDDRADWREAWIHFPGDVAYVWFGSLAAPAVAASLESVGFELRYLIIWNKGQLVPGRGHYHWKHEPCWYAVRKGATGHWVGGRKQSTVWDIANRDQDTKTGHSTQKPVECMLRPMQNNSNVGEHVYEPFSGSGTTIIAGQQSKRIVHAVELNPVYVDVAVARWEAFTGETAILAETGQAFSVVKAERLGSAPPQERDKTASTPQQSEAVDAGK